MTQHMRQSFASAAATYDDAAVLARTTGACMAERLDYVKLVPACIADIGCATGDGVRELQKRYPKALPLAIDSAVPMLHAVRATTPRLQRLLRRSPQLLNADMNALPVRTGSLGLIWSNLVLHWLDDPLRAFRELLRSLEVGGLLMFAALGPDTLKEIRLAFQDAGYPQERVPLRRFHDMHDLGDMLLEAGFADPVMDMEMIKITYASPRDLLRDQRHLGVRDALFGSMPWRDWRRVFCSYAGQRVDGRLPASFEIIYGHAWKPAARIADDGRAIVRFAPRPK
ncbi:MAG: methyltransferase domain-containing protein [Betaproteobacteria bacterium]|nr:methyltransferase domain-containing protein [Betaproteobacteria bacterium]